MKDIDSQFRETNKQGMDAQRFGQIAKGLHAATTFEEVDAKHTFDQTGSLIETLDSKHLAVNGPNRSLDILSPQDLSVVINLNTETQMPFAVLKDDNLIWAGCNQGYLFNWKIDQGFQGRHYMRVSHKISQMVIF